ISVVLGTGLPEIFPGPYLVNYFLFHFNLGSMGLIVGIMVSSLWPGVNRKGNSERFSQDFIVVGALVFSLLSFLFESVNLVRVGGIETVLAGKAVYQSAVSELTGTLPTGVTATAAFAFLGLLYFEGRARRHWVFLCIFILMLPL